jgi:hypothetical protein
MASLSIEEQRTSPLFFNCSSWQLHRGNSAWWQGLPSRHNLIPKNIRVNRLWSISARCCKTTALVRQTWTDDGCSSKRSSQLWTHCSYNTTYPLPWQKKGKAKPPVQRFHAEFDRLKQQPVLQLRSESDVAMDGDFGRVLAQTAGSSAELCICSKRWASPEPSSRARPMVRRRQTGSINS